MRMDDPARPSMYGSPMYLSKSGKPIAVMPTIKISPGELDSDVVLSVMLMVDYTTARWFDAPIYTKDFPALWQSWMENPEAVLQAIFNYDYEPGTKKKEANVMSLEDLGL